MSWIEDAITKTEAMMREQGLTFEARLKYLEGLSVEEDERIAKERYESGWKDDLRTLLAPLDEGLEGQLRTLSFVASELTALRARDTVVHHYLLKEIRQLRRELAELETSASKS